MGWAERDGDGERHRGRPGALSDPWTNLGSGQMGQQGTSLWEWGPQGAQQLLVCLVGGTGLWRLLPRGHWSAGQSAGSAGSPQHRPPLPRESLPTTQCMAPQSVLGFHMTPVTSGRFWRVHLTPLFRGAASCGLSPQPALSFRGGHHLQPTTRPAPGLGRRLGPGMAWGVTQHVAAPCLVRGRLHACFSH